MSMGAASWAERWLLVVVVVKARVRRVARHAGRVDAAVTMLVVVNWPMSEFI